MPLLVDILVGPTKALYRMDARHTFEAPLQRCTIASLSLLGVGYIPVVLLCFWSWCTSTTLRLLDLW